MQATKFQNQNFGYDSDFNTEKFHTSILTGQGIYGNIGNRVTSNMLP